ncbi:hypothetical protein DRQ53_03835 [bacterium]|nr:MAG: hypothetical protein DRQ32_06200 [bacterium]RKZ17313.1 MAG: hypothetical protein DRQ53_03835 [bacterium]
MRILLFSLLAVFALAACSSGGSDTASQEPAATETAADTETTASPAGEHVGEGGTEATVTTVASVQTGEVEIAGKLGCGHCTHSIGEGCSAAVQTADGAVYILEGLEAGDEPFEQRFGGKTITVRGSSVERDGIGYVTVAGFDL